MMPSDTQSTTASAVADCTTPPSSSTVREFLIVTLGTIMVAGLAIWLQSRTASMRV